MSLIDQLRDRERNAVFRRVFIGVIRGNPVFEPRPIASGELEVIAKPGELVTCVTGHPICRVTSELWKDVDPQVDNFEWLDLDIRRQLDRLKMNAVKGEFETVKCKCGSPFYQLGKNAMHIHFEIRRWVKIWG